MVGGYQTVGSMRLAAQKNPFQERDNKSQVREPKSQYIFFSEGVETEKIYFEKLSRSDRIKDNINIKFFSRWKENVGRSNQLSVVEDVIEYIESIDATNKNDIKKLKNIHSQLKEDISLSNLIDLTEELDLLTKTYPSILSKSDYIKAQIFSIISLTEFDSIYDKIIIILDRDSHSFSEEQFESALQQCDKNKITLGLTNPCFEFFLLLHFDNLDNLNENEIKQNKKTGNKTFVEKQLKLKLSQFNKNYKKNNYDANFFIERINVAIKNSKLFKSDILDLKEHIGSSIFKILEEIIK